jgi:hypothetical protein
MVRKTFSLSLAISWVFMENVSVVIICLASLEAGQYIADAAWEMQLSFTTARNVN